jgi:hypothetical protein
MRPLELTMLELGMFGPTSPLYSMPGLTLPPRWTRTRLYSPLLSSPQWIGQPSSWIGQASLGTLCPSLADPPRVLLDRSLYPQTQLLNSCALPSII